MNDDRRINMYRDVDIFDTLSRSIFPNHSLSNHILSVHHDTRIKTDVYINKGVIQRSKWLSSVSEISEILVPNHFINTYRISLILPIFCFVELID